jgi:hypothetical protein
MKALFFIMSVIAAYLFILGFSTRNTANEPLGRALIIGSVIIFCGVLLAWFLARKSEQKDRAENKNNIIEDSDI